MFETWEEIQEALGRVTELTDDELAALQAAIAAHIDALLDEPASDETNAAIREAQQASVSATAEKTARDAEVERIAAENQALRDEIAATRASDTPVETDDDDDEGDESDDESADEPEAKVPVAASGKAPVVSRVAARRPEAASRRPSAPEAPPLVLRAAAGLSKIVEGTVLDNPKKVGDALIAAVDMGATYRGEARLKVPFATLDVSDEFKRDHPERYLTRDAVANDRKIQNVVSPEAIRASGGICAPIPPRYDFPEVGTARRPVRDALARFGADRGGIRTFPAPLMSDVASGVGVWTNTTDTTPGVQVKPCVTMTCPEEDETIVEAITRCLEVGNFRQRFFPEQVARWQTEMLKYAARYAENRLLTTIAAGSTAITTGTGTRLGTARHVLADLDRWTSGFNGRHRADDGSVSFRAIYPQWLRDNMRVDILRQMPVGTVDETFVKADAEIDRWFSSRNVNVTWTLDGLSWQDMAGAQGDGPLNNWPTSVVGYVFPEGTWLFLDGGQLDLGVVRDSSLNSTNDFQMFAEAWEGAHFYGYESAKITSDICPDGSASALIDIDPCSTGS